MLDQYRVSPLITSAYLSKLSLPLEEGVLLVLLELFGVTIPSWKERGRTFGLLLVSRRGREGWWGVHWCLMVSFLALKVFVHPKGGVWWLFLVIRPVQAILLGKVESCLLVIWLLEWKCFHIVHAAIVVAMPHASIEEENIKKIFVARASGSGTTKGVGSWRVWTVLSVSVRLRATDKEEAKSSIERDWNLHDGEREKVSATLGLIPENLRSSGRTENVVVGTEPMIGVGRGGGVTRASGSGTRRGFHHGKMVWV
uniref:Uncharacterized protein n=1 Tax=Cannabis sativa TaxID=3483 RepID=A0A803QCY2_CANSA